MSRYICLLILAATLFITACDSGDQSANLKNPVETGNKAADIVVTALNNNSQKLSDLKGKVVLLNFWATWCPPCREEIPSMIRLNKRMTGKPFQMLAVSLDEGGKQVVESFLKKSGFELPAYIDIDNKAAKSYGVTGVPETYIIDKKGVIVKKVIGPMSWDDPEVISLLSDLMK